MKYPLEAYLDIETTGLSPVHSEITVVGIHRVDRCNVKFIQLVGEDVTADSILEALEGVDVIYTYNGSRFDLPFIYYRFGVNLARLFRHCDLFTPFIFSSSLTLQLDSFLGGRPRLFCLF